MKMKPLNRKLKGTQ